MTRTTTILSTVTFAALFTLVTVSSCKKPQSSGTNTTQTSTVTTSGTPAGGSRIAYVDIDTFESHYENLKKKREELKSDQQRAEAELQRSAQQMQADYNNVMQKQQAGKLTESEAQAAEKRLGQMQQSLETRRGALSTQFQEKLEAFNKKLHDDMDAFLTDYIKDHPYDYVLSYSSTNAQILYANKGNNITADVIKGMNERAAKNSDKSK
jgi:outer membrane protein